VLFPRAKRIRESARTAFRSNDIETISYRTRADTLIVETHSGMQFQRRQFPLRLAYACTVDRSQGPTIDDGVVVDVTGGKFMDIVM